MERLKFRFKDGTIVNVTLVPHVAKMWREDRVTMKALSKYGSLI